MFEASIVTEGDGERYGLHKFEHLPCPNDRVVMACPREVIHLDFSALSALAATPGWPA